MVFFDCLFGKKESEFIPAEKGSDDFDEGKIVFIDAQLDYLTNELKTRVKNFLLSELNLKRQFC